MKKSIDTNKKLIKTFKQKGIVDGEVIQILLLKSQ